MTPSPPTTETVRAVVADVLDEPVSALGDQDDLLELGLDSIRLMTITEQFRRRGSEVALVDLVENPTIAAWTRLLGGSAPDPSGPPGSPAATGTPRATGPGTPAPR